MKYRARRFGGRATAPAAFLVAIALAVGACASSLTGGSGSFTVPGAAASTAPITSTAPATVAPTTGTVPAQLANPTAGSAAGAFALQETMVSVIEQVNPAVVQIETDTGLGSGVVYDSAGHIITNAHVVGTSTTFKVTTSDGKVYNGTLVGSYAADDIAVIKVDATGLTPAVFGDSSQLNVGDFVLAMGNPLGLQSSVTEGIVSALSRAVAEPNGNTLPDVIQTSAAINPGNSGGALVDLNGHVVGIPTLAATDSQIGGSAPGIGFAISSNRAVLVANQLISSGKVTASGRAYLGVTIRDGVSGAVVVSTVAEGPAATAGVVAGDVILSIDGAATPDSSSVGSEMAKLQPGDVVPVQVQHQDGTKATLNVTLGQLPG